MSRIFEVVTPEHVAIRYELAGIGSRGVAVVIDTLLQGLLYLPLGYGYFLLQRLFTNELERGILMGLGILVAFLVFWGYFVLFETLWNGETPGKRMMGLRVIKDAGYPVDFRAVVTRNLIRIADFLPITYAVGFIVVLIHAQYKRLGDCAAGTVVVRHGHEEEKRRKAGEAVVFRLLDATVISQISRLTRVEYRMVQQFLERRNDLPVPLRVEFARRLAQSLIEKFNYQVPALGMDYTRWLEELDLAYRQRTLGVTTTVPLPAASAPVPVPTSAEPAAPPVDTRKW